MTTLNDVLTWNNKSMDTLMCVTGWEGSRCRRVPCFSMLGVLQQSIK